MLNTQIYHLKYLQNSTHNTIHDSVFNSCNHIEVPMSSVGCMNFNWNSPYTHRPQTFSKATMAILWYIWKLALMHYYIFQVQKEFLY